MSDAGREFRPGDPRSAGAIPQRRVSQAWPKNGKFRILSIDGGGIRGIFPAAVLAGLEREFTGGRSIASYFDLVAGTSTGGILALGLGAGYTAADLLELYVTRGNEIFPEPSNTMIGRVKSWWRPKHHYLRYHYERDALERVLTDKLERQVALLALPTERDKLAAELAALYPAFIKEIAELLPRIIENDRESRTSMSTRCRVTRGLSASPNWLHAMSRAE
jgi:Patatin-like phospholipase